nr:hypothetical protein [Tanacetum cinerariifolium]
MPEIANISDSKDNDSVHLPKIKQRHEWLKPLPDDERPATPKPAWVIPSSHIPDAMNNWANALATTYQAPAENSLLEKTREMRTFMQWYCQQMGKTELTQPDFEGQSYEVVKASYLDVLHLQFQMEECHKMLTDQIDWANPEGDQVRIDALSISKMKATCYLDFDLELLVPEHIWINEVCTYDISASYGISHWWFNHQKIYIDRHIDDSSRKVVRTHIRILSVVSIKGFSRYGYDYLKEITLRRADYQEYTIAEKDFKSLYPIDFEDLNLFLLQGHLNHLSGSDKRFEYKHDYTIIDSSRAVVFPANNNKRKIMRFNEIYKFSDGTLTNIMEALDFKLRNTRNLYMPLYEDSRPERSFESWNALLVVAYEILATDCFREPNEHFISALSFHDSDIKVLSKRSSIKVKGTSRSMNNQAFTIKKSMSMPIKLSQAQDGKTPPVDDQRLDLADDLKETQYHISSLITSHETKITTSIRYHMKNQRLRVEHKINQKIAELKLVFSEQT